jgi:small subunit ribosomal protein S2
MSINRREMLFEAGVQYGHRTRSWCPKMKSFIWGKKDGIHLINIALTDIQLKKAEQLLEDIAAKGLPILWVGTKKVARTVVTKYATACENPFFADRWVGGALTNYQEVKKSVTNMLYDQEILDKSDRALHTKKELNLLKKRIGRAHKTVGGIERLTWPVGALIVADVQKDNVAVKEAAKAGIPVVAIVDTNCDPEGISIVIPGNDDLEKSVDIMLGYLCEAIKKGKERFVKENPVEASKQKENANKKNLNKNNNVSQRNASPVVNNNNQQKNEVQSNIVSSVESIEAKEQHTEEKHADIVAQKATAKKVSSDSALKKLDEVIENVTQKKQKKDSIEAEKSKSSVEKSVEIKKASSSVKSSTAKKTTTKTSATKTPAKKK